MHNNLNNDKKEHMKIEESKRKKESVKTLIIMKKNSRGKMTKKERWTNVFKLQMKETVFLVVFKFVACLIHPYSQHQILD